MSWCRVSFLVLPAFMLAACAHPNVAHRDRPSAGGSTDLTDSTNSDRYRATIHYPPLTVDQAPLTRALRAFGDRAKQDFLAVFADPEGLPDAASFPWRLSIDMQIVAQTGDFVSVVAKGDNYTGGAHGNPILASFTYQVSQRRIIALDDLFADAPAGRDALADFARRNLLPRLGHDGDAGLASDQDWILRGTAPSADNYQVFTVLVDGGRVSGLKLWFPAYQVASYADGIQTVDVPTSAFAAVLKPEYRTMFGAQMNP